MTPKKRLLKNGEARWTCRVVIDGKKKELSAPTRRELIELYDHEKAAQRRRRHGLTVERGPITYSDLCDLFLAQYQYRERSKRSLTDRLPYSRRAFGSIVVRDLLPETIAVWNNNLPVGPTTRGHALRAMRQVLDFGVQCGYLEANAAARTKAPQPARRDVRPFESWEQVEAVAAKAGRYGPLIVFACATGLRPQEWRALEWRDVDLNARELRVSRTIRDEQIEAAGKTDGSLRTVALQQRALDALDRMPRPIGGGLIFPAPDGGIVNPSNYRKRVWKPALAAAGLDYRALDNTRHTFATLALAAGAPLEWVSGQMGHTNINTTKKHYARWLPRANDRNLAILDQFAAESQAEGRKVDGLAQ